MNKLTDARRKLNKEIERGALAQAQEAQKAKSLRQETRLQNRAQRRLENEKRREETRIEAEALGRTVRQVVAEKKREVARLAAEKARELKLEQERLIRAMNDQQKVQRYGKAARELLDFRESILETAKERRYLVDPMLILEMTEPILMNTLIFGPPGNGKSMLGVLFGKGIVLNKNELDPKLQIEPSVLNPAAVQSFSRRQLFGESLASDVFGGYSTSQNENGWIKRIYEQGITRFKNVVVDEFGDSHPQLLRALLEYLAERQLSEYGISEPGLTDMFVGTTNIYIHTLHEKFAKNKLDLSAFLDRSYLSAFVPKGFSEEDSQISVDRARLSRIGRQPMIRPLENRNLVALRELAASVEISDDVLRFKNKVCHRLDELLSAKEQDALAKYKRTLQESGDAEPPYRKTKVYSPRYVSDLSRILQAVVVMDWVAKTSKGQTRELKATYEDVRGLLPFLIMHGPEKLQALKAKFGFSKDELKALEFIEIEQTAAEQALEYASDQMGIHRI